MTTLTWTDVIGPEKEKAYFQKILHYVQQERTHGKNIFPPQSEVFNAFQLTPFEEIRVVILGQDPYHGQGQAHGLAFSVKENVPPPPSLKNIYKELCESIAGFTIPSHGNLEAWAKQGVLLLNTVLTVEQGRAHSHANIGWETFTDVVIEQINQYTENTVFLLWGAHAQKKGQQIDRLKHCVLTSVHPSPLSAYRGFFGCRHFPKTNEYLLQKRRSPIEWQI